MMILCVSLFMLHPRGVGASSPVPAPAVTQPPAAVPAPTLQGIPDDTTLVNKTVYYDENGFVKEVLGWGDVSGLYYDTRIDNQLNTDLLRYTQSIECWVDGTLQGTGVLAVNLGGVFGQFDDNDTLGTTVRVSSTGVNGNLVNFVGQRQTANPRAFQSFSFTIDTQTEQCVAGVVLRLAKLYRGYR